MNPPTIDLSVLFLISMGVIIGIMNGLQNIKETRSGNKPAAPKTKDKFVYVYMDFQ